MRFMKKIVELDERPELLQAHLVTLKDTSVRKFFFPNRWHSGHFWPGMRKDFQNCVNSFLDVYVSMLVKSGFHSRQFTNLLRTSFEIDTITGFNTTDRGNVILVETDVCTRFKLKLQTKKKPFFII